MDDGFIGTQDQSVFPELKEWLKVHFKGEGTLEIGKSIEFLNKNFNFNLEDQSVRISQESYWNKVIERFKCLIEKDKPHTSKYMERINSRSEEVGTDKERTEFLSLIMSIMWGAKRTQQCTLFNTTSLASQSKFGTKEDMNDALQLLQYINKNKMNM